jgi:hypothetical protein
MDKVNIIPEEMIILQLKDELPNRNPTISDRRRPLLQIGIADVSLRPIVARGRKVLQDSDPMGFSLKSVEVMLTPDEMQLVRFRDELGWCNVGKHTILTAASIRVFEGVAIKIYAEFNLPGVAAPTSYFCTDAVVHPYL